MFPENIKLYKLSAESFDIHSASYVRTGFFCAEGFQGGAQGSSGLRAGDDQSWTLPVWNKTGEVKCSLNSATSSAFQCNHR